AVAREQLAPFLEPGSECIRITGEPLILPPALATPLALVLHELATNAAKYGALKGAAGFVELSWQVRPVGVDSAELQLTWHEHGVSGISSASGTGRGTILIDNAISGAQVDHDYRAEGLLCTICIPLHPFAAPQRAEPASE